MMRVGGGKSKGASFERKIATHLSLWYSQGKRSNLFWRSSNSGGRATMNKKKILSNIAGDICAIDAVGAPLTDKWFFELKHVKDLRLITYLLGKGGPITKWWLKAQRQAIRYRKMPMLILKQNSLEPLVLASINSISEEWPDFCPDPFLTLNDNTALYSFNDLFPKPAKLKKKPTIKRSKK
jgi:hypothetical protein